MVPAYTEGRDSEFMNRKAAKTITAKVCMVLALAMIAASVMIFGYSFKSLEQQKSAIAEFSNIEDSFSEMALALTLKGKPAPVLASKKVRKRRNGRRGISSIDSLKFGPEGIPIVFFDDLDSQVEGI